MLEKILEIALNRIYDIFLLPMWLVYRPGETIPVLALIAMMIAGLCLVCREAKARFHRMGNSSHSVNRHADAQKRRVSDVTKIDK